MAPLHSLNAPRPDNTVADTRNHASLIVLVYVNSTQGLISIRFGDFPVSLGGAQALKDARGPL